MKLQKLKYVDEFNIEKENVSKKVEFFIHYWECIFTFPDTQLDQYYLRSHRSVIQKLRLQVDGNFSQSKKYFKLFLLDESLFSKNNIVIKSLGNTIEKRTIKRIKKLIGTSNWEKQPKNQKKLSKYIGILEEWLVNDYSKTISDNLLLVLENDLVSDKESIQTIKELTNCFILELFNKGFNQSYIEKIPEILFDKEKFPFKKSPLDFDSKDLYEEYRKTEWSNLTLKTQIEGIINLLNYPIKNRQAIFHVFDLNWRHAPITILGIEFYNPNQGFNPKCDPSAKFKIFEETFTSKPDKYENGSRCNAIVRVDGIQENQILNIGYARVKLALTILNRELDLRGRVYKKNAFTTNLAFDRIWGSMDAIYGGFKAFDGLKNNQPERLNFINQMNADDLEDLAVVTFISKISEVFKEKSRYSPERIWMILEATFGSFKNVEQLFKSVTRIYLKKNFAALSRIRIREMLNPDFGFLNTFINYELNSDQLEKLYLSNRNSNYQIKMFNKNVGQIKNEIQTIFTNNLIQQIENSVNDKINFYNTVDSYIEYLISELYSHRNLSVHKNLSDDLFLLKHTQLEFYSNLLIEYFMHEYLNSSSNRSIKSTVKKINGLARRV